MLFFAGLVFVAILPGAPAAAQQPASVSLKAGDTRADVSEDQQPDPAAIRLRSIRGITQRFPLFFGPPVPGDDGAQPPEAVVVVLMSAGCPVVNQYVEKLRQLHHQYNYEDRQIERSRNFLLTRKPDGSLDTDFVYPGDRVRFLGVHPIPNSNVKEIARHAVEKDIPFRVLQDPGQTFIQQYGELVNGRKQMILGQVMVFDRQMNLVYSGAINDQFAPGSRGGQAENEFLQRAIDSVLDGQPLQLSAWERAASEPQGCIVRLQQAMSSGSDPVTYYEQIHPLLTSKKCYHCHRPGAVGSNYELLSYDDVVSVADMIEQVISDRRMPPWPGYSPRKFRDEESLLMTDQEIALFRQWVRDGMPAGNPDLAERLPELPDPEDWSMNEPDFVFEMNQPYRVPESGRLDYVYYPVEMNLREMATSHPDPDKRQLLRNLLQDFPDGLFIEEIEVIPGAAPVVHHIQVHEHLGPVDREDAATSLNFAEQILTYGFAVTTKLLGSFTPGNNDNYRRYSKGDQVIGMHVQPEANLLFELHYTPNGTPMLDQSKVGIRFARTRPDVEIKTTLPFRRRGDFNIAPNQSHFTLQDVFDFETRKPIRIERIRPHMHVRGKSVLLQIVRREQYTALVQQLEAEGKTEESLVTDPELHGKRGVPGETLLIIPAWDFEWQRTYKFEKPVVLLPGDVILATGYWDNTQFNTGVTDYSKNIPFGQQVEQEMFTTLFIYRTLENDDPDVIQERARRADHPVQVEQQQ